MKAFARRPVLWAIVAFFLVAAKSDLTPPSQGTLNLTLIVRDDQGRAFRDTEVEFVEINTREMIRLKTDASGTIKHTFESGRYWQINIKQVRDYFFWQFEVRPKMRSNITKNITYNFTRYERETRPPVDRSKLNLQTERQRVDLEAKPATGMGIIKLNILKGDKMPLGRFPVAITCYKIRKTFTAETNAAGWAVFEAPLNNEYEIDIDGIESYEYVDLPDKAGYRATKRFTYEPTIIQEKEVRDTIQQTLDPDQKGTSGSVITQITLYKDREEVWRNEPVFLEVMGENKWYRGTTDQNGQVRFLLPKGKRFLIHGKFEFALDVIDLRRRRGIGYSNKRVLYRPREKYMYPDRYIPKPEEVLTDAFDKFLDKQYGDPSGPKGMQTHAAWDRPVTAGAQESVLRLAFTPNPNAERGNGPPLNISLVIDKSGSMASEDRMEQLKPSLIAFAKRLRPKDRVSLVLFEDFETVVIPSRLMGTDRSLLIDVIERLEPGGGTNIFKGMVAGYQELKAHHSKDKTSRLILLSDGYGTTAIEEFGPAQEPYTKAGIECSAVGVGEDYNYPLLSLLATKGGGLIEHVGKSEDLQDAFLSQLNDMLHPVARNLTVEVHYPKSLEYKQLYGFPVETSKPGVLRIKLRNVYGGLDQMAYIRFKLNNPTAAITNEPVLIKLRYQGMGSDEYFTSETKVPLKWSEASGVAEMAFDANERKMYAIAVMNRSLKIMADRFHSGDLAAAKAALSDGLKNLEKVYPDASDEDLNELEAKLREYFDILKRQ